MIRDGPTSSFRPEIPCPGAANWIMSQDSISKWALANNLRLMPNALR